MAKLSSVGLEASIWAPYNTRLRHNNQAERPPATRSSATIGESTRSRSVPPRTHARPPSRTRSTAANKNNKNNGNNNITTTPAALSPTQALRRFEQACQRLRWKSLDLEAAYRRALTPSPWAFTAADAERNFKVDFYEFYAWIEKAIVLLLVVFSVPVPSSSSSSRSHHHGNNNNGSLGGRYYYYSSSNHAYHHNVIRALETDTECPLHRVFGRGDVNHALWKAKELRNRWKDAAAAADGDGEGEREKETPPLKMYDLAWIVGEVLRGLEEGYGLARAMFPEAAGGLRGEGEEVLEGEDQGWDWMVEMMDWEANG